MKNLRGLIPVIFLMVIVGCDKVRVSVDPSSSPSSSLQTEADVSDRDFAARHNRVRRGVNMLTIRPRGPGATLDKIAIIKVQ